jgi:glycosyltransferase involved in cell wall biosynthesis
MTIKTLHITNSYHPASGGIRTFYHALLEAANVHCRQVRLVVPADETFVEDIGEFGRIYHIAAPRAPILDRRYRWLLPHKYAWPADSELRRVFATEKPDLVEVCDKFWLLFLAGVLRQGWIRDVPAPAIVGLSCERLDENVRTYLSASRAWQLICQRYMRWCFVPRYDFYITASDYIAEELRPLLNEQRQNRLHVCPMGVDYEALSDTRDFAPTRTELMQRLDSTPGKTVLLLYAGRLSKEKNLQLLAPMLGNLARDGRREYRLLIAGDGPLAGELRDSLELQAPHRSLFLGQCDRDRLLALFRAADIFIHPNPREPFGLAPLEAMAAGLPLVAPRSGGVVSYANSRNAWLAEATPEAFVEAVLDVDANSVERTSKIENARATAARFSWPLVTSSYFELYDRFHEQFVREGAGQRSVAAPGVAQNDPSKIGFA